MKRYVIERDLPGAGKLTAAQLQQIRQTSNAALAETGPGIQWVQSFVTADRIYCHYLAESVEQVREHARRGGFPATQVNEVQGLLDPLSVNLHGAL